MDDTHFTAFILRIQNPLFHRLYSRRFINRWICTKFPSAVRQCRVLIPFFDDSMRLFYHELSHAHLNFNWLILSTLRSCKSRVFSRIFAHVP